MSLTIDYQSVIRAFLGKRCNIALARTPTRHAPKTTGVTIKGKHFAPGQFIYSADYKKATPEQKAAIDAAGKPPKQEAKAKPKPKPAAAAPANPTDLAARLAPHHHHQLTAEELATAARSLKQLQRHHGERVSDRLAEIAEELDRSYVKARLRHGYGGPSMRFSRRLAMIGHQLGLIQPKPENNAATVAALSPENFTGVREDSLHREYHWVHGKRVPGPPESPHIELAERLANKLREGEKITADGLFETANEVHGGTRAEGKYGPSEAYDSLETAFNLSLAGQTDPKADLAGAVAQAESLADKVNQLPTQTNRSGNKEAFQQFSTPPHYAYAINWLANLNAGDTVLEPTAGTGSLAVHAANAGAKVITNELDPTRAAFLAHQFGEGFHENAEQIGLILPGKGVHPTAVVMNPPFSQTAGRMGDKKNIMTGANHIMQALQALQPGGRLVAIVGGGISRDGEKLAGMSMDSSFKAWFNDLAKKGYTLRANVGVEGDEYKKYGTRFGTRTLIIDKVPPTADSMPIVGEAKDIPDLMSMLEGVRNDRPAVRPVDREPSGKSAGDGLPAPVGVPANVEADAAAGPDAGMAGRPTAIGDWSQPVPGASSGTGASAGGGYPGTGSGDAGQRSRSPGERTSPGKSVPGAIGGIAGGMGSSGRASGRTSGDDAVGGKRRRGSKVAGGQPGKQSEPGSVSIRPAEPVKYTVPKLTKDSPATAGPASNADLGHNLYEPYRPQLLRIDGASVHDTPLVESAAMAAVTPPVPTYIPKLSPDLIAKKTAEITMPDGSKRTRTLGLSEHQLEAVIYAGQAHEQMLEPDEKGNEFRRGFMIGDGTGCIAAGTRIFNPLTGEHVPVEVLLERNERHTVLSLMDDGRLCPRVAEVPFVKGVEDLYRVTMENGKQVTVTTKHRFLTPDGWLHIEDGLCAGSILRCVADKRNSMLSWAKIQSIEFTERAKYYDLHVPGPENYVAEGIIHHNTGKGRDIAGIMMDNSNHGRKKHVWISQSRDLIGAAKRDWTDMGGAADDIFNFDKIRDAAKPPKDGIAFLTYAELRGGPKDKNQPRNVDQLAAWLGKDFDGVISLDESHSLGNAMDIEGGFFGTSSASQQALAGIKLQKLCPNARVIYVSATGATEVKNLAYAERLGIWGKGTPFVDKRHFVSQMTAGGVGAMEAVAQSLKATGSYIARGIGYSDGTDREGGAVDFKPITHHLTPEQRFNYDAACEAWQHVLANVDDAIEITTGGSRANGRIRAMAMSQFWGQQQRFYNQFMTSMQTPSVINAMEEDRKNGIAPVVALVNTMKASLDRALAKKGPEDDLDDLDVSPKEILTTYIKNAFPTEQYEQFMDADGNVQMRPVLTDKIDENGNVVRGEDGKPLQTTVENPGAVALRDEMLEKIELLKIPASPLDMILQHFGHNNVAEVTGRNLRVAPNDEGKMVIEKRGKHDNDAERTAFMNGEKFAAVVSGAGLTGFDYHADKGVKNQNRRRMYLLQPGWRADAAVQSFGRVNRTNQTTFPIYSTVQIGELQGQKRFISTIARRLEQLGALTKGQQQTGGGGVFSASDNLESPIAKLAMDNFFDALADGAIEGLDHRDVMKQLGLYSESQEVKGKSVPEAPASMGQFLNRLLALKIDTQNKVFGAFDNYLQATTEKAAEMGLLDMGVENFKAQSIKKISDEPVYKEPASGAEVRHLVTMAKQKNHKRSWMQNEINQPDRYVRNLRSGHVWAVYEKQPDWTDPKTGAVIPQVRLRGITSAPLVASRDLELWAGKYEDLSDAEAKAAWEKQYHETPDEVENEEHFLVGALLPIWDRIPGEKPKIYRIRTEDGRTVVGRHVPAKFVPEMFKKLRIEPKTGKVMAHDPAVVHGKLESGSVHKVMLANGWWLKPVRVQGERRIELLGPSGFHLGELAADGVIKEKIAGQPRFFVPVGIAGVDVMKKITKARPIADVQAMEATALSASENVREEAIRALKEMFPLSDYTEEATSLSAILAQTEKPKDDTLYEEIRRLAREALGK